LKKHQTKNQFRRKVTALSMAAIMTLLGAQAAFAEGIKPISAPDYDPVIAETTIIKSFEVKGIVEWIDLETGYYAVDGWRLVGDQEAIERYAGQYVYVEGYEAQEASIFMNQALVISAFTPISEAGERGEKEYVGTDRPLEPDQAEPRSFEIKGTVEYNDLEGGFYSVNGLALLGVDKAVLARLVGTIVAIDGRLFDGATIYNVEALEVDSIKAAVATTMPVPNRIAFDGKTVEFDQQPVRVEGTLMVPIRFVVEAAGGTVAWNAEEFSVSVRLGDRTATFVIGQDQAEMNQDGHNYLVRNMLKMERAPVIMGNRTLISADALDTVLGLFQSVAAEGEAELMLVK